jgi:hypothetical protein
MLEHLPPMVPRSFITFARISQEQPIYLETDNEALEGTREAVHDDMKRLREDHNVVVIRQLT